MFFETIDLIADRLSLSDAVDFHKICNQSFITKWMNDWILDLNQVKDLLAYFVTGYEIRNPEQAPFVMGIKTQEQKLVGICGYGPKEELGGDIEIAYFIDEEYSGKGYMSQIVEKAIDFYFELTKKPYLCALVDEDNEPSKRILLKNGFTYQRVDDTNGILKSHYRLYRSK